MPQRFMNYGISIPIPKGVLGHLASYIDLDSEYFRKYYPYSKIKHVRPIDHHSIRIEVSQLRLSMFFRHQELLATKQNYGASGIASTGFIKPERIYIKSFNRYYLVKYV